MAAAKRWVQSYMHDGCCAATALDGFNQLPFGQRTAEACELAIELGASLAAVPQEHRHRPLCLAAVSRSEPAGELQHVPQHMREGLAKAACANDPSNLRWATQTPQLCLRVVSENGLALRYVEYKTPDICAAAVEQNPLAIEFVPPGCFTAAMCEAALACPGSPALHFVPYNLRTAGLCRRAVELAGGAIRHVPLAHAPALYETAVASDPRAFAYLPVEARTRELSELAVQECGDMLAHVPEAHRTQTVCDTAAATKSEFGDFPPEHAVGAWLTMVAAQQRPVAAPAEVYFGAVAARADALDWVPPVDLTADLCANAVAADPLMLSAVPAHLQTPRLQREAVRRCLGAAAFVRRA